MWSNTRLIMLYVIAVLGWQGYLKINVCNLAGGNAHTMFFVVLAHLLIEIPQYLPLAACTQTLRNLLFCLALHSPLLACSFVSDWRAFITLIQLCHLQLSFYFSSPVGHFSDDWVACHSLVILLWPLSQKWAHKQLAWLCNTGPCYCTCCPALLHKKKNSSH